MRIVKATVAVVPLAPLAVAMKVLVAALNWTFWTGLLSYLLGEAAKDLLGAAGTKSVIVIVIFAAFGLTYRYLWQLRRGRAD
jgi:membrane protein DedA with SNARE-associated domain